MAVYDANLQLQTMQEPIKQAAIHHHRAVPFNVSAEEPPSPGQPYGRTIGADLFQLGSLGSLRPLGQAQTST